MTIMEIVEEKHRNVYESPASTPKTINKVLLRDKGVVNEDQKVKSIIKFVQKYFGEYKYISKYSFIQSFYKNHVYFNSKSDRTTNNYR